MISRFESNSPRLGRGSCGDVSVDWAASIVGIAAGFSVFVTDDPHPVVTNRSIRRLME
jgi:hypothetical protein